MKPHHLALLVMVLCFAATSGRAADIWIESEDPSWGITNNRGRYAEKKGDYEKALQYFATSIRIAPHEWATYYNRARIYILQRKWNLALQDINTIIRLKPSFLMASIIHAKIQRVMGNYSVALQEYDAILKLKPLDFTRAEVLSDRAWILATCPKSSLRDGSQAVADAKAACNITGWKKVEHLNSLAAAYAETGNFDEAVRVQEKAIERAKENRTVATLQQLLQMYREHRPYRSA